MMDVKYKIMVGWVKWREMSGVLCDERIPIIFKGRFNRCVARPTMLYDFECWVVDRRMEQTV